MGWWWWGAGGVRRARWRTVLHVAGVESDVAVQWDARRAALRRAARATAPAHPLARPAHCHSGQDIEDRRAIQWICRLGVGREGGKGARTG